MTEPLDAELFKYLRGLGKPPCFDGNDAEYQDFRTSFRIHMSLVSTVSQQSMDGCEVERNPISLAAVQALGDAHLKCCMQMCYSLALITKGSVRTLVRSVEESKWSRGMASDTQQICSRHSESTVRFDAEDHRAFRTRPAAQCDPYHRQAVSKCSNSSKTQQQAVFNVLGRTWIHEHFLCMHNSSKTVPMSRRLTVWATTTDHDSFFFTITRHMSRCCVTCNVT